MAEPFRGSTVELVGEQHRRDRDAEPARDQPPAVRLRLGRFHLPEPIGGACNVELARCLCLAQAQFSRRDFSRSARETTCAPRRRSSTESRLSLARRTDDLEQIGDRRGTLARTSGPCPLSAFPYCANAFRPLLSRKVSSVDRAISGPRSAIPPAQPSTSKQTPYRAHPRAPASYRPLASREMMDLPSSTPV